MAATPSDGVARLSRTVIDGGYCIGCGACVAVADGPISVELDALGRYQALLSDEATSTTGDVLAVCPFSEEAEDEDSISRRLFTDLPAHPAIGRFLGTYAGEVVDDAARSNSSSGGLTSWLLRSLLERELVDAVVHVAESGFGADPLFGYRISRTADDVSAGAKTRYYPTQMGDVLSEMRSTPGRYAVVGPPCFIKAIRLLAASDNEFNDRITFAIALVCGHLKSARFGELISWQAGIRPSDLGTIDFRHKLPERPANRYGAEVVPDPTSGQPAVIPMDVVIGGDWGLGYFKYQACDYCDDVVGETADCSLGDAWLPQYVSDWRGTNVVVTRHPSLEALLSAGVGEKLIRLDHLGPEDIASSQQSGLRHRRDGLSHRLERADREGRWRPPKRIDAGSVRLSRRERRIFDIRVKLAERSHEAFAEAREAGDLSVFFRRMAGVTRQYDRLYGRRPLQRARKRLRLGSRLRRLARTTPR